MKSWEDLDILDNYLINVVASEPAVAGPFFRCLISVLLQRKVGKIKVAAEKIIPGIEPGKRGIRLDVEVEEFEEEGGPVTNIYDLEPHIQREEKLPRMMRLRQAKIDSRHMNSGDNDFTNLPDLYVILITNYDIFQKDYMMYTFRNKCEEDPEIPYADGLTILYFNTTGKKGGSRDIENMLKYLQHSRKDLAVDDATKELDRYVDTVKSKKNLEDGYMTAGQWMDWQIEEELKREIFDLLKDLGDLPVDVEESIKAETDRERIRFLLKSAAKADSIDDFIKLSKKETG